MNGRDGLSAAAAVATGLAAATLLPVYDGAGWVPAAIGAVAVVAAGSVAARHLRLPVVLQPVLMAVAVACYLTAVFARSVAPLGFLPGRAALGQLGGLARQALADIAHLATPVPTEPGLVLLAVGGVAVVALVVDLLATAVHQPPLAGLPLLALYAVPAAVAPDGVGLLPFAVGVVGYLVLLATDQRDRLGRWGSRLRTSAQQDQAGRLAVAAYQEGVPRGAMARRIGAAAIVCAAVLPALVPTFGPVTFGSTGDGTGGGGGPGGITTYNPIVNIRDQLTTTQPVPVIRLATNDPAPVRYLRLAGLDRFDGHTWSQSTLTAGRQARVDSGGLPAVALPGPTMETQIRVLPNLDARWLPLPYQPAMVTVGGDWRYDTRTGSVFSFRDNARDRNYTVRQVALRPNAAVLRNAPPVRSGTPLDADLGLPADLPATVRAIAAQVTRDASTPYDKALAIQAYFRSNAFSYSTAVPKGNGNSAMVDFLAAKTGFCEQYAATMAVFARLNGIPARVAVGFTYGEQQPDGSYQITTRDAHAWPELYFPGAGWLPFEPTPIAGRGTSVVPEWTQPPAAATTGGSGGPTPTASPSTLADTKNRGPDTGGSLPPDLLAGGGGAQTGRTGHPLLPWLLGGLLVLGLLVSPALTRVAVRRRRRRAGGPAERAHAAWAELREDAVDLGFGWPESTSPRGAQRWLADRVPLDRGAQHALALLVQAEERASYAPPGQPTGAAGIGVEQVAVVRAALAALAGPRRRWQAVLMPPSALERGRLLGERLAEAADRAELAASRWLGRLGRLGRRVRALRSPG